MGSRRWFIGAMGGAGVGVLGCSDDGTRVDAGVQDAALDQTRTDGPPGRDAAIDIEDAGMVNESLAPVLSNFRVLVEAPSSVYFDSSKAITAGLPTGFEVSQRIVSAIVIAPGATTGHHLTLTEPLTFWDNNTVRYEGGSDLVDLNSNPLKAFSLRYVENELPEPQGSGNVYYVATDGSSANDGLSESQAWSLEHAFATARAGETVHIKAGNYGVQYALSQESGSEDQPIKFIGYRDAPGDITDMYFEYGITTGLDSAQMPLIDRADPGDPASWNLRAEGDYVVIKNLQATNGRMLFQVRGSYGVVENCIAHTSGQVTDIGLQGIGFRIGRGGMSRSLRLKNSVAVNCSLDNIILVGDGMMIDSVQSFCDRTTPGGGATDYYFELRGSNNIFRNLHAERVHNRVGHTGHGISLKAAGLDTEYNLVENCTVVGVKGGVELRHSQVRYNVVRNVDFRRGNILPTEDGVGDTGSIVVRDGTSHNLIENCTGSNLTEGVTFRDQSGEEGEQEAGTYNKFVNCVWRNSEINVGFARAYMPTQHNEFINCLFYNAQNMFVKGPGTFDSTNKLINCVISDVEGTLDSLDFTFEYCNFFNYYGATPSGTGNVSADPHFRNPEEGDFRLTSETPAEVADGGVDLPDVGYDKVGNERVPGLFSIGPYERD